MSLTGNCCSYMYSNKHHVSYRLSVLLYVCTNVKKGEKNHLVKHFLVSPHIRACHFYRVHGCDKDTPFPSSASSISISFPDSWWGGGWGGCSAWTREIVLVSAAFAEEGEERGDCLFEDSARSPRLPGSLKLFDDRTGQHHCRWRGGCAEERWGICIQLFLSSCSAPLLLPLLYLCVTLSSSIPLLLLLHSVLRDPFRHFKEVIFWRRAHRPAARRAGVGCRKRK